jgi:hypothetical protein
MPTKKEDRELLKRLLRRKRKVGPYDIIRIDEEATSSGWKSPNTATIGQGIKSPYIVVEKKEIWLYNYRGKKLCRIRSFEHLEDIMTKIDIDK